MVLATPPSGSWPHPLPRARLGPASRPAPTSVPPGCGRRLRRLRRLVFFRPPFDRQRGPDPHRSALSPKPEPCGPTSVSDARVQALIPPQAGPAPPPPRPSRSRPDCPPARPRVARPRPHPGPCGSERLRAGPPLTSGSPLSLGLRSAFARPHPSPTGSRPGLQAPPLALSSGARHHLTSLCKDLRPSEPNFGPEASGSP